MARLEAALNRVADLERVVGEQNARIDRLQDELVIVKAEDGPFKKTSAILTVENRVLRETNCSLSEKLENATDEIKLLKKQLFGSKRERYIDGPGQGYLFEVLAMECSIPEVPKESVESGENSALECTPKETGKRKAPRRLVFPETLERKVIEHRLSEGELPCSCCGKNRVEIKNESSLQLEVEPPKLFVIENKRFTYACPHCRSGKEIVTPPKPPAALEKGLLGPSIAALLTEWKYARHVPVYRMQDILLAPLGQWASRPLLCGLLRRTAEEMAPLADWIRDRVLSSYLIHVDETTIKMLAKGVPKALTAYLWGYAGGTDQPFVYYDFSTTRGRESPDRILSRYKGWILTDGYTIYESLARERPDDLIQVGCWAHGRRKFIEALTTGGGRLAHSILGMIQELYDLEAMAKDWTPEDRKALRMEKGKPILDRIRKFLDEVHATLRPQSTIGKACFYLVNHWRQLNVYLTDGRIPIDNNIIERNYKAIATGKKNYLFLGRDTAGPTAAILYTIVRNAMNHNLDVFHYLHDVLKRLPLLVAKGGALDELLPDRWALENPDRILKDRIEENQAAQRRKIERRTKRRLLAAQAN